MARSTNPYTVPALAEMWDRGYGQEPMSWSVISEGSSQVEAFNKGRAAHDADMLTTLCEKLTIATEALREAKRLHDEALPKFNWGASALDANAIRLLNEVPGTVNDALRALGAE